MAGDDRHEDRDHDPEQGPQELHPLPFAAASLVEREPNARLRVRSSLGDSRFGAAGALGRLSLPPRSATPRRGGRKAKIWNDNLRLASARSRCWSARWRLPAAGGPRHGKSGQTQFSRGQSATGHAFDRGAPRRRLCAARRAGCSGWSNKPTMVGLAVGIVENGRITFLKGYGETLAGSGEQVTPETVFRWASVSKGVAATMVAKLAEQGKVDLNAPVANYAPQPEAARPPTNIGRRVGDMLSHRLGLYRNAYDNKLEEGRTRPLLRQSLATLNRSARRAPAGAIRTSPMTPRASWSQRSPASPTSRRSSEHLFNPIGMTSASVTRDGLISVEELGAPAQCRPAAARGQRHLLPRAGRRRRQQQHQGHGAVDDRADGRDAGCAVPAGARHHPRAAGQDPGRARPDAQVPRARSAKPITAMAGAATIMPATTSSAIAAASTAIAR